jgi:hypothetical protein
MIIFTPLNISLTFGHSLTGVVQIGPRAGQLPESATTQLTIPWHDLLGDRSVFPLLSWHTRISEFAGREEELAHLATWADSKPAIWVKFVTGEGGVGKSRLAAEFVETMQGRKWSAGFADLKDTRAYPMEKAGTLVVIDYPEENRQGVADFLHNLAGQGRDQRFRVLFLTRQPIENWEEIILEANADDLVDRRPIDLGRMDGPAAFTLYDTALKRAATEIKTYPPPLTEEALAAWLDLAPENDRALFILAAAVHSALNPDDEVVRYSGREVVDTLVRREVGRLRRIAKGQGAADPLVLARVLALATIADVIPVKDVIDLAGQDHLQLGFAAGANIEADLQAAGLLVDRAVQAPKPDILAAAFLVHVLSRNTDTAPELVWAALWLDLAGGLDRLGRLCHDAEIVLGIHQYRLSTWLAWAVEGRPDRCHTVDTLFSAGIRPLGWNEAAVVACRTLFEHANTDEEKARLLNNLSNSLSDAGDNQGALEAIKEAADIYRRLAASNPARFEPDLASSLNNLSNRLSDAGDNQAALEAIKEAVDIRRRLAASSPARFEPDLAMSLNNMSNRLADAGDNQAALEAIKEAVDIRRRLTASSPARFEPDLASSLNNMSNRLADAGDNQAALEAIKEAADIYRRLAASSPARFEPDLAGSLNNMSTWLNATGDNQGALEAIQEAADIHRRLAASSPARFEPDLAGSLNNMGSALGRMGRFAEAAKLFEQGAELVRPYAEKWPGSPPSKLLDMLESNLATARANIK